MFLKQLQPATVNLVFCLSARSSMTPTGDIFVKFDNDNFYKNLSTFTNFA